MKGPKTHRDFIIEWDEREPLPPGAVYTLALPYGGFAQLLAVRVASNQRNIDGTFTIRARIAEDAISITYMDNKQLKETLAGLGLSKQEVEIILGAISGVKIAPLAYSSLNDMTAEIVELKEYKAKIEEKLAGLAEIAALGDLVKPSKKERKPRSDKGTTRKPEETPPAKGGDGAADVPMRVVDDKAETKAKPEKKKPTPRAKESEDEIKQNVAALGEQAPPPGVDL